MKQGILFGVGVGPGDPELITVKAVNIISNCDAVCFPAAKGEASGKASAFEIARAAIPELASKEHIPLELPMTRDEEKLRLGREKAAGIIIERLEAGKDVVFLTLGDPSIYSTFGYLRRIVEAHGCETRAIPGVTSFCAAAAAFGEDLVLWEEPLHIIPASCSDIRGALCMNGTRVLMKSGAAIAEMRTLLQEAGLGAKTRIVENCGMANERVWKSLDDMGDEIPGYFTLLIIKENNQ